MSQDTVDFSSLEREICDFTDMEQQQEQQWTSTEKQLINEHRIFHQNMGTLIDTIESYNHSD
jgi:hypothetical protein